VILLWLLLWWLHGFPALHAWNDWLISLIISLILL
jgi:hypothetical protein